MDTDNTEAVSAPVPESNGTRDPIVKRLARSAKTFSFMMRRNPERALDLLALRIERVTGAPLYFLSTKRLATHVFELMTTRRIDDSLHEYGNYYLDRSLTPESPVVFSLGIGRDIRFDEAVWQRHPDATYIMADPTPISRDFIKTQTLPKGATFHNVAVSDRDGTLRVFPDELASDLESTSSVSINAHGFHSGGFEVPCMRMRTLMDDHKVDHIDVFKADIEGAALGVLESLIRDGIFPTQIACEFERPRRYVDIYDYLQRLQALFNQLQSLGYEIYRTRDLDKGFQIEILAVRRHRS